MRTRQRLRDDGGSVEDDNNIRQGINRIESGIEEPGTAVSLIAELEHSDRGHPGRERPDEDAEAIQEQPVESDQRSSLQGTIG